MREVLLRAVAAEECDAVRAGAEARAGLVGVVEHDPVEVLLFELDAGVRAAVVRLQREADERLPVALPLAEGGEDVRRAAHLQREVAVALLQLPLARRGGGVVGHGGGGEDEVGVGVLLRGGMHLVGARDVEALEARRGRERGRAADEHHAGAAPGSGLGEGVAHRTRRAVREEADRVDGFARRAGGDENLLAVERAGGAEHRGDALGERLRLRQPPGTDEPAGELAVLGLDHRHAILAERSEVPLRGRVDEHVVVHRRGHDERAARRERRRREHRIADSGGELGERRRGGRGDDEEVGPEAEVDVLRPAAVRVLREDLGEDLALGERAERERRDEARGVRRHQHLHLGAGLLQQADELGGLVRRDRARDAERDLLADERR